MRRVGVALAMTREDLRTGLRYVALNRVAAAPLMPRLARQGLYRAAGLDVGTATVMSGCRFVGVGEVAIGARTFLNHEVYVEAIAPVTIGEDCAIGMQAMILTSTHPFDDEGNYAREAVGEPVRIGDRCWLGARATVLPGVTLGDDVVVAAGAVVTADCAPAGIYAGIPARRIRDLTVRDSDKGCSIVESVTP